MKPLLWGLSLLGLLAACSGSGDNGLPAQDSGCTGQCADTPTFLSVVEVETVLQQSIREAQAQGKPAVIAITDRVGNVLALYQMNGFTTRFTTHGGSNTQGGLDKLDLPPAANVAGAISKAVTGAYLSSEGNAFSTRTASFIVQQHFLPKEIGQPSGPLFGVQFSQLACSDLTTTHSQTQGPHRSPLGLAADSGGVPLYKNGTVVGGLGIMADGEYGADTDPFDRDSGAGNVEEIIALAGMQGFEAPADRRGDRITADSKPFRYMDAQASDLRGNGQPLPDLKTSGKLVPVPTYTDGTIKAGTAFGTPASGFVPANSLNTDFAGLDAFVLVDDKGAAKFPPKNASDGTVTGSNALTANEAKVLLQEALKIANRARAQIRRPLSTPARVTVSVVDSFGAVLGVARTRDAPVFGTDVSLQKARSAAFFSNPAAASDLAGTPSTTYFGNKEVSSIAAYGTALNDFAGIPLNDGLGLANRSIGNLARPFYPDGVINKPPGPLSKPIDRWSVFSTGLQLDLANDAILQHVVFLLGGGADVGQTCTKLPNTSNGQNRLRNGLQIFPGSVPIYRGNQLVGAIGISGDGVDQDDMIAFLGLHNASQRLGTLNHAPRRADTLQPQGVRLRYVQCPQAPFIDSNEQNVCAGK
jgi:uncharacterized protein GlcG (DUF336 family)